MTGLPEKSSMFCTCSDFKPLAAQCFSGVLKVQTARQILAVVEAVIGQLGA